MNLALRSLGGILALLTLLAGCGSSPRSNYYLLTTEVNSVPTGDTPSLGIGPVTAPEYLNRNSMVFSGQGNRLQVSSSERWAEPIEAGIQRVVAVNLAASLNTQDIRYFPWNPKHAPDYGVSINLLQFDANDQEATLTTEWKVFKPNSGESVAQRINSLHLPLPEGPLTPRQIAPAYSELLSQLSALIGEVIEEDIAAASPLFAE